MKIALYILLLFKVLTISTNSGDANNGNRKSSEDPYSTTFYGVVYSPGTVVIASFAIDNISTSDGDNSEILSVSDAVGNVYTKLAEYTNGSVGAGNGATISMWMCRLTNTTATNTILTADFSGAVTAKAFQCRAFSVTSGYKLAVQSFATEDQNAADAGSLTLSSLPSREYLVIRTQAIEIAAKTNTGVSSSTNYTQNNSSIIQPGTTGSTDDTNMSIQTEYRIVTSTSETTDPTTTAGDGAGIMIALYEIPESKVRLIN